MFWKFSFHNTFTLQFPSMASLHSALPTMTAATGGLLRTSSLGTPASNPSAIPHAHSFPSIMPSSTCDLF